MSTRMPHVDDRVRLLHGVPETELSQGQIGVVCSTWSGCSTPVFEVEFHSGETQEVLRRLLTLEQITIDDADDNDGTRHH